jgi:hypothetical protein
LPQIADRQWGFRIVAVVAFAQQEALDICKEKFGAQYGERSRRDYAEVVSSCEVRYGNVTSFVFQE